MESCQPHHIARATAHPRSARPSGSHRSGASVPRRSGWPAHYRRLRAVQHVDLKHVVAVKRRQSKFDLFPAHCPQPTASHTLSAVVAVRNTSDIALPDVIVNGAVFATVTRQR